MSLALIDLPHISVNPTATQLAFDKRDALVLGAAMITTVITTTEAQDASNSLKELKAFTRAIEDQRKFVKQPVLELSKRIDDLAKELTVAVDSEAARVSRLLGDYSLEQQRLQREAEQKARDEERRIQEEAARKQQAAIDSGKNVEAKLEKIEAKTFVQVAEVRAQVGQAAPKIAGVATRNEVKFDITDAAALYAVRPELFTLTPNAAQIKSLLKAAPNIQLPGLQHWTEAQTVVR